MTTPEKVELTFIPLAVAAVGLSARFLPAQLNTGLVIVIGCLGWLVQGGIRDVWFLYRLKTRPSAAPRRKIACMCLESSAGFTGLLLGIALAVFGLGGHVGLSPLRWMLLATGVLALGFAAKDYIVTWHPLGLRREPEHHSFVFTWW
jgi:hypothetical protein